MIPLRNEADLQLLRKSGKILAKVMLGLQELIAPGVATKEIDAAAQRLTLKEGALCAFKGYKGYPASVCVSINEEIVHGIPGERVIRQGDILSLDLGVNYKGYFTDAAITIPIGKITPSNQKLIDVTKAALFEGIKQAKIGSHLSDISHSIQEYAEINGFSVVRQFVGHGIGKNLHEEPEIPNFGLPGAGPLLKSGMVLAIEPMINTGTWEAEFLNNGWTAVTKDRLPSAHFEHTLAITDKGPEILTL
ncbi:MAG: type I methionyl aminopeptidase [Candidatus Omnitrophica bacterium]|nr:type I methionyl aminopeptidase [Candidatus Omnitrophota bacterium]